MVKTVAVQRLVRRPTIPAVLYKFCNWFKEKVESERIEDSTSVEGNSRPYGTAALQSWGRAQEEGAGGIKGSK
jgi:hypothetical protein